MKRSLGIGLVLKEIVDILVRAKKLKKKKINTTKKNKHLILATQMGLINFATTQKYKVLYKSRKKFMKSFLQPI